MIHTQSREIIIDFRINLLFISFYCLPLTIWHLIPRNYYSINFYINPLFTPHYCLPLTIWHLNICGENKIMKKWLFFFFHLFSWNKKKKKKKQLTHGSVCVKDGWQNHKIILFVVWFWCLWYFQMEQNISWNLTRYPFFHQSPCGIQCRL